MDNFKCKSMPLGCGDPVIPPLQLSQAYIKDQIYENILPVPVGFHEGTIFKDLVRPKEGHPCKRTN